MIEVVVASKNPSKLREITRIMSDLPIRFLGPGDIGQWPDIEESGSTYVENAMIKAAAVAQVTGRPALADDSGLEVDALNGLPGVRSARFAGLDATDEENNLRLVSLLHGVPPERRRARYRCAAVLWAPGGLRVPSSGAGAPEETTVGTGTESDPSPSAPSPGTPSPGTPSPGGSIVSMVEVGICEGWIATEPKGTGGFGYDPWFIPEGYSRRMAELTDDEKDSISHRGKAVRGLRSQIESLIQGRSLG